MCRAGGGPCEGVVAARLRMQVCQCASEVAGAGVSLTRAILAVLGTSGYPSSFEPSKEASV